MSTRRELLKQAAATLVGALTSAQLARGAGDTRSDAFASAGAAKSSGSRIKSVIRREDTVVRHGGTGDNWHMSWAGDDRQYVSLCDGAGLSDHPKTYYNSRMIAVAGGPRDAKFYDLPDYPMLGKPKQKTKDPRYYGFGTLALDGHLYQFMSTWNRAFRPHELDKPDATNLLCFNGVKLIYSPDGGRSWHNQDGSTPVAWEDWSKRSRETMTFFEEHQGAFSLLSVLQMGKNYGQNRDGFVYIYAPNGNTDGTMNELVMFRVRKNSILDRTSYEYFNGLSAGGAAKWSKDINARAVVHTFPRGWVNTLVHPFAWHPSVVYNAPLGLYMMANWGMGTAPDGLWFGRPSYLGFWIAKEPWGPWTQVHEESAWLPAGDKTARAYEPQISPKWIAADGKSFWLVWTDYQVTNQELYRQAMEEFKHIAETDSYSEADVRRSVARMRQYRPYYAFNVQRVDLLVT